MTGLASEDISKQATVKTLARNGQLAREPDPVDEALATKRKLLGARIVEQTVAEQDTEAIKAENERFRALAEQRELRQASQPTGNADPWREFLMQQMQSLQGQLNETQQRLSQQQTELLQERMDMLRAELEKVRSDKPKQVNQLTHVRATVEEAKAILELVSPAQTPPPPDESGSATLNAWVMRTRFEQERWLAERQDHKEERMRELEQKLEFQREELALRRQHDDRMDRFFTETMPKVLEIGNGLLNRLMAGQGGMPPVAAAQTAQAAPLGILTAPCQQCGAPMQYRPDWQAVGCLNCGAQYQLQPEQPATVPASEQYVAVGAAPQISLDDDDERGPMA